MKLLPFGIVLQMCYWALRNIQAQLIFGQLDVFLLKQSITDLFSQDRNKRINLQKFSKYLELQINLLGQEFNSCLIGKTTSLTNTI